MIEQIIQTARQAGDAILTYYDEPITVEKKADDSPLTKADLASHEVIIKALAEIDPDTPVISEEAELPEHARRKQWPKFWIVDPLDGTKEFIKKNGEFTVNIALIEQGEPVLGVIYIPAKETIYYAQKGKGSYRQKDGEAPQRIYSTQADKSNSLKVAASRSHQSESLYDDLHKLGIEVEQLMPAGSSLKFCLVAEGSADVYPRMGPTMEWDVAAGDAIFRNSAREGQHPSPITYNKPTLKNEGFVIGA